MERSPENKEKPNKSETTPRRQASAATAQALGNLAIGKDKDKK